MTLIYIASKFSLKEKVIELKRKLHNEGHLVTINWWDYEGKKVLVNFSDDEFYNDRRTHFLKERDLFGIRQCEIFVLLSDPVKPLSFNGANFELGYATALHKDCYIIGKIDKTVLYAGITFCKDEREFVSRIPGRNYK